MIAIHTGCKYNNEKEALWNEATAIFGLVSARNHVSRTEKNLALLVASSLTCGIVPESGFFRTESPVAQAKTQWEHLDTDHYAALAAEEDFRERYEARNDDAEFYLYKDGYRVSDGSMHRAGSAYSFDLPSIDGPRAYFSWADDKEEEDERQLAYQRLRQDEYGHWTTEESGLSNVALFSNAWRDVGNIVTATQLSQDEDDADSTFSGLPDLADVVSLPPLSEEEVFSVNAPQVAIPDASSMPVHAPAGQVFREPTVLRPSLKNAKEVSPTTVGPRGTSPELSTPVPGEPKVKPFGRRMAQPNSSDGPLLPTEATQPPAVERTSKTPEETSSVKLSRRQKANQKKAKFTETSVLPAEMPTVPSTTPTEPRKSQPPPKKTSLGKVATTSGQSVVPRRKNTLSHTRLRVSEAAKLLESFTEEERICLLASLQMTPSA
jgi:hypothetical protein